MNMRKIIKILIYLLVFVFLCSYFSYSNGYYEYRLHNKGNLTNEQILKFEQDVKDGKNIDINDYLEDDTVDYSNQLTRATSLVNIRLNNYLKEMISKYYKFFEKLVR